MKSTAVLLIIVFLCLGAARAWGAQYQVGGRVIDASTAAPLEGANVLIEGATIGLPTDADGGFLFPAVAEGVYTISVSYIGYRIEKRKIDVSSDVTGLSFAMEPTILPGEKIYVTATRARIRHSPATFSDISAEELEERYTIQDIPALLSELPSTSFYSQSGNGIGYNYLTLRGFDQRRISVMINGVPQNDPEDHDVYWIDFPDLAANLEDIQLQRGAGSSFYGPPAIGGSINLQTAAFSSQPEGRIGFGAGSFNTRKYSMELNSGLIDNTYSFYARFSRMLSDGYRNDSWVDYNSYFFGAARYTERTTTRINVYGGPIKDHLAYYGVPKSAVGDRELRKINFLSSDPEVQEQIENFYQPHYELLHSWQLNENCTFNNTLFYVQGDGFFDFDGSWADTTYYRITPDYGFNPGTNPGKSLIRAHVGNKQGGWLPRMTIAHPLGELNVGIEARYHQSLHWGRIEWAQQLPLDVPSNRHFYEYKGAKTIASVYADEAFRLSDRIQMKASLQTVYNKYRIFDEHFAGNAFDTDYLFVNPRLGINVNFTDKLNGYLSYSRTEREPRLKNLYDAAESSGGAVPQFEERSAGVYDFENPLVKPEVLDDFELGFFALHEKGTASINLFWMDFTDEIVKKGGLDRFGIPITGNADRTVHRGIEIAASFTPATGITLSGNASVSRNELEDFTFFDRAARYIKDPADPDSLVAYRLDGNRIAGFPDLLWNARASYAFTGVKLSVWAHHEGKKYSNNFEGRWYLSGEQRPETVVDSYTVLNASVSWHIDRFWELKNLDMMFQIFNLTDKLYASHGDGDDFFPAATRNVYMGITLGL
jgi:iron complex outermembrane receptor protein